MATVTRKSQAADGLEPKVVALAEQVGWFMGTVAAKAEGWLDQERLRKEVGRIRDGAAELLEHVNRASAAARKAGANPVVQQAAAKKSAAPGKKHRKPPPQERIDKRMGESEGKQKGQKQFRPGQSRGRG